MSVRLRSSYCSPKSEREHDVSPLSILAEHKHYTFGELAAEIERGVGPGAWDWEVMVWLKLVERWLARTIASGPWFWAAILLVMLAACGGGDGVGDTDNGEEASASPTAPPMSGPPILGDPVWSTAIDPQTSEPIDPVNAFSDTDSVLYLVFPVERWPQGTAIDAQWYFNDTAIEGMNDRLQSDSDRTGGWLEFHLIRASESVWPDGTFRAELTYDGTPIANPEINVIRTR